MVRVLRVLCREDFSIQSAKMFAADLKMAIDWLDAHFIYTPEQACYWWPMVPAADNNIPVGFVQPCSRCSTSLTAKYCAAYMSVVLIRLLC